MLVMAPDTITVLRYLPGPKDKYGNVTETWQEVGTVKAHVVPEGSTELSNTQTTTRYLILVPLGTDFEPEDRIEWQDFTFEIDGDPNVYPNLPGMPGHIEFFAVITSGGS